MTPPRLPGIRLFEKRTLILIAATTIAIVTVIYLLLLSSDQPSQVKVGARHVKPIENPSRNRPDVETHKKPLDPRISMLYSGASSFATRDQAELYLAYKGRTPDSLSIAFYISSDWTYMDELVQTGGGDSVISLSTLAIEKDAPRLACAEKLISRDPSNSFGYLMKYAALVKAGKPDEAAQVLGQVQTLGKFHQYDSEKALGVREAWRILGLGGTEAHVRSYLSVQRVAPGADLVINSVLESLKATNADPNEDNRIAAFTPYLKVPMLLAGSSPRQSELALFYEAKAEQLILRALPEDFAYGDTGTTIGEYLSQKKAALRETFDRCAAAREVLLTAAPSTVDQYYERVDSLGEVAAVAWLLSSPK